MHNKITPLEKAIELIDAGNNIFITGGGGVGKSYILNKLKKHYGDKLQLTSTTGVSAYNIGGQTIHSFAGIYKNRIYLSFPDTKKKLIKNLKECKILAIDEISMLHKETLDSMDSAFKEITGRKDKPFGGVQMVVIGDFFQLPPVQKQTNKCAKSKPEDLQYCFKSAAWNAAGFITLDLQEVKRQSDKKFISALNKVRTGNITQEVIDLFEERERKFNIEADSKILRIFSKKIKMNSHNNVMLTNDKNCSGNIKTYVAADYYCETIDNKKEEYVIPELKYNKIENKDYKIAKAIMERECRYPQKINLRNGCRVMLLKNLNQEKGLVNGSCGVIKSHSEDDVVVKFDKINEEITIKKDIFYFQYRYTEDEETGKVIKKAVKREQFPLQLAYAITIHKAQGMTFDKLVIDLDNIFSEGMSYVALSRNRTLENLYIKHFKSKEIKTSQEVIDFYNNLENRIIFTEDGEMIEDFAQKSEVKTDYSENQDNSYDSGAEITIPRPSDEAENLYNDLYSLNENSCIYEYTIAHYNDEIELDPNNCSSLSNRAEALCSLKDYENAVKDWNRILDIDPEYEIDYFKKAYAEHKIDNNEQAIEDYTKYLLDNPKSASAYNNRGRAKECFEYCNYKDAIEDYNNAVKLDPDNCMYLNNRARAYYWHKDYIEAIDDWNKVADFCSESDSSEYAFPETEKSLYKKALMLMADAYYENDEYDNAVNNWNKVLEIDNESDINYFDKAYAEGEIGLYNEAIDDYTKYLEDNPDSAVAYNNRGWAKYSKDYSMEDAIEDYNKAINIEPDDYVYINNRAIAYYENDEYEKAIADWNKVLEINPEYEIDYFDKANAEYKEGLFNDAILSVEKHLSDNFDDEDALKLQNLIKDELYKNNQESLVSKYLENAELYYEDEEYEKAVDEWNKILEIDPEYEINYFDKAYAEDEIGFSSEAIDDYTKYLEQNSESHSAYNNRGLCQYNLEYYEKSIPDYNKAIELAPENPMYINNRANAYFCTDEYEKAIKDWNKVLNINPEYDINYYWKAIAEKQIGKYEDALLSINKYLNDNPENKFAIDCKKNIEDKLSEIKNKKFINKYKQKAAEYLKQGFYNDAYEQCEKILAIDPDNAYAHMYLGAYYHYTKNYSMAENEYKRAIEIDNEFGKAYKNLGILMHEQRAYELAIQYYEYAEKYDASLSDIKEFKEQAQKSIANNSRSFDNDD